MGEYIPVQEFADRVGITFGAVNRRIDDPDVAKYVKGKKGERTINTDASGLFKPRKSSGVKANTQQESDGVQSTDLLYSVLQATIQELSGQLKAKDIQLAEKDIQIAEKDKQLEKLNDHLTYMHKLTEQRNQSEIVDKVQLVVDNADTPARMSFAEWLRSKLQK